jgi:hypothetical protein
MHEKENTILWKATYTLGVDGGQVGVFEEGDEIG